jgi:hypothetical protein
LKTLLIFLFVGMLVIGRAPGATAYEALEVLKKERGEAALKKLVEVQGKAGQPQPASWTVLMTDPAARGGIREFVIANGAIGSERTPVRGYTSGADAFTGINFGLLNVDSGEAFKVANKQAAEAKVGFHTLDYTLRTSDVDGSPVWVIQLFDYMGAPVGTLRVSAESGKVLTALQIDPDARQKPTARATPKPTATPVAKASAAATPEPKPVFKGGVFGFVERTSKNVGRTVKKGTLNAVGSVQEVLTGERTIGDEQSSEE